MRSDKPAPYVDEHGCARAPRRPTPEEQLADAQQLAASTRRLNRLNGSIHDPLVDDRTEDVLEQMEMAAGMRMLMNDQDVE